MLQALPTTNEMMGWMRTVPYEDLTSDSDGDVSSAAVPYEDLTPRSAGQSSTLENFEVQDRIHRVGHTRRHIYIKRPPISPHTDI